jgi:hypothetical protein
MNTAIDIIDLDPLFRSRGKDREVRYRSIIGEGHSFGQSNKEIEDQIELTAAKMSKNLHLQAAQSAWSSDSSDTETENKSDFSWDGNESEIWTSVARGQKIMSEVSRKSTRSLRNIFCNHTPQFPGRMKLL